MPQCKKCDRYFSNRLTLENGKRVSVCRRKYCLDCSPYNTHNTKKLEKQNVEEIRHCKICYKNYVKTKNNKLLNKCGSCHANKNKKKNKIKLVMLFGGKCNKCGYNKCVHSLVFHHKNPQEKKFTISGHHSRSLETLMEEAKKCELLCSNCHQELHHSGYFLDFIEPEYII